MTGFRKLTWALTFAALLCSSAARAALHDRGAYMFYDDLQDITWLGNSHLSKASGYAGGLMSFSDAVSWTANLVYGGFDDWRLPSALNPDGSGPCEGSGCSGSEMGNLHLNAPLYEYLFLAFVDNLPYWTGTAHPTLNGAWSFDFASSSQQFDGKAFHRYAFAVRDGDVAVSPVPEPETYALLLAGLGLLGVVARRRRRLVGAS